MDVNRKEKSERETWNNHMGYVLSLFGYLSGSGDCWKFPYLFWTNGGGAFLIAYMLAIAVCSLPVYYLEVAIPQYSGKGMYEVWSVCPLFSGVCITMVTINIAILLIYPTVRLWIMAYIRHSFSSVLPWTTCGNSWNTDACIDNSMLLNASYNTYGEHNATFVYSLRNDSRQTISSEEEFWNYKILQQSSGIEDWGSINWELCLYNLLLRGLVVLCVIKSIQSIEKVMYITTVVPFILLFSIFIRALTLPGATESLVFFLTPDFSKFTDIQMWMQAGFAGLNTLAIGMGGTMVVASKGKFKYGIFKTMMCACSLDVFGSIFTCSCLVAVLGVMATEQGKPISTVVTSGTAVGFVGFTRAFSYLPGSKAWSIIFFCCAFFALLDVIVITKETIVDFIKKSVPFLRNRHITVVLIVFVSTFLTSLPFVTQAGPYLFQIASWYYGSWSVLITTLLECVIFMWIVGADRVDNMLRTMIGRPMPFVFRFLAAYVCPVIYVVFLGISIATYRPPVYGDYHYPAGAVMFGYLLGILPMLPIPVVMALKVYRRKGTIKERISELLKPSCEWGPVNETDTQEHLKHKRRTFLDIAYYNATGRLRERKAVETEQELNDLMYSN